VTRTDMTCNNDARRIDRHQRSTPSDTQGDRRFLLLRPAKNAAILVALAVVLIPVFQPQAAAQDSVTVKSASGTGELKIAGQVIDYNGRGLTVQRTGSTQSKFFPISQVVRVVTNTQPLHRQADLAAAAGRYDEALEKYRVALNSEPRRWVKRLIMSQMIRCYTVLGKTDWAGNGFIALLQDDPDMLYFDEIPLNWLARQTDVETLEAARKWMKSGQPVGILLGASYLLTTQDRPIAKAQLQRLITHTDRRIALMARAQLWRTEIVTANVEKIDGWQRATDQFPVTLSGGPCYVIGLARKQQKQYEQAAVSMLRVPVVAPENQVLAASALLEAGIVLTKLNQPKRAAAMFDEINRNYPLQKRTAEEARSLLMPGQ